MDNFNQSDAKIKFYIFAGVAAFILSYGRWYEHHKYANIIRVSVFLILFGIPHCAFNEFIYLMYKKSANSTPRYLRLFAVTPDRYALKFMGFICSGLGLILFFVFYF